MSVILGRTSGNPLSKYAETKSVWLGALMLRLTGILIILNGLLQLKLK